MKPILDNRGGGFATILVSPIGLTEPIADGSFRAVIARISVKPHPAYNAISIFECDCKPAWLSFCVFCLYRSNPLTTMSFSVRVWHPRKPTRHFPIVNQRH